MYINSVIIIRVIVKLSSISWFESAQKLPNGKILLGALVRQVGLNLLVVLSKLRPRQFYPLDRDLSTE